ncbi:arsenic resistance N-acetyltransferase ArsN2 [Spirosoma luteolum]
MIRMQPAQAADRPALEALLGQVNLPTHDLPADLAAFVVARTGDSLVGVAGLESYGSAGLLRSVAVDPAVRGQGLAARLIADRLAAARAEGLTAVYLLTTTAAGYFERQGFRPIGREQVPDSIRQTGQFRSVCPASANVLYRPLTAAR